jgi:hypothetical protein
MTNALNDLVLTNILTTIAHEDIRYVGLLATDARDKLFLASVIREHCPDVRLFTTEGNLLLAHPEYAFAMRGAIVATTYPLHPSLQRYTDPYQGHRTRLLFSQQLVQGTYNAVLAQLDNTKEMIGYAVPRTHGETPGNCITKPPVWLCEVSPTGRLVPLKFDTEGQDDWDYLVERRASDKPSPLELHYDPLWASAVIVLSLACGLLFIGARRASLPRKDRPSKGSASASPAGSSAIRAEPALDGLAAGTSTPGEPASGDSSSGGLANGTPATGSTSIPDAANSDAPIVGASAAGERAPSGPTAPIAGPAEPFSAPPASSATFPAEPALEVARTTLPSEPASGDSSSGGLANGTPATGSTSVPGAANSDAPIVRASATGEPAPSGPAVSIAGPEIPVEEPPASSAAFRAEPAPDATTTTAGDPVNGGSSSDGPANGTPATGSTTVPGAASSDTPIVGASAAREPAPSGPAAPIAAPEDPGDNPPASSAAIRAEPAREVAGTSMPDEPVIGVRASGSMAKMPPSTGTTAPGDPVPTLAWLFWPPAPVRLRVTTPGDSISFQPMAPWKQALALACCFGSLAALYGLLARLSLIPFLLNWHVEIDEFGWGFYMPPAVLVGLAALAAWWWRARSRLGSERPWWSRPAVAIVLGAITFLLVWFLKLADRFIYWAFPPVVLGTLVGLLVLMWRVPHPAKGWLRFWCYVGAGGLTVALALAIGVWVWGVSVQEALVFERALDLGSGLSSVVPAFFLAMVFFSWGFFQLKSAYLLEHFSVWNPFATTDESRPKPASCEAIESLHKVVGRILADLRWNLADHWRSYWFVYVAIGLPFLYLLGRVQPTFEGFWFDLLFRAGFVAGILFLGLTFAQFHRLWKTVRGILKHLSMMPLDRAFDDLPSGLAGMFSGYLYTSRPRRAHFAVPVRQFTGLQQLAQTKDFDAMLKEFSGCSDPQYDALAKALAKDIAQSFEKELHDLSVSEEEAQDTTVGTSMQELRAATSTVLDVLQSAWQRHPPDEVPRKPSSSLLRDLTQWLQGRWVVQEPATKTQAAPSAARWIAVRGDDEHAVVWKWVQLAENFVATQAVLYVSQFFVQLRNLLLSVTIGTLLLLLAATSYPFQPQSLLVVYLLVMVGVVTVGTVSVLVQINRNSFVSRLSNTTPERFTPDWAFLTSFATYVLPLLGVLAVQLSGSFRTWLEPVFRILK